MARRRFIQKATRHKGALKRWAKLHHFLKRDGTINLTRAHKYAKRHHLTKRLREINLAKTLRRLRRKR